MQDLPATLRSTVIVNLLNRPAICHTGSLAIDRADTRSYARQPFSRLDGSPMDLSNYGQILITFRNLAAFVSANIGVGN